MSCLDHSQIREVIEFAGDNSVAYTTLDLSDANAEEIVRSLFDQNYVIVSVKSFTLVVDRYYDDRFCICLSDSSIEDDRIFNVNVFNDDRFKSCLWLVHFNILSPWKGINIPLDTLVDIIRWLKLITSAFA